MADPVEVDKMVKELQDIEAIKKLKARYWRCIDKKLWGEMEEIFTEDATLDYADQHLEGGKAIVQAIKKALEDVATAHGGHSPEIEVTSDFTARGIWALQDYLVWEPGRKMVGFGHYEDEYVKVQGRWKKKSVRLTRTFEEWTMTKR
ncbi:nuclear transport factor 2 family protein [Chloroflexota bacterium]